MLVTLGELFCNLRKSLMSVICLPVAKIFARYRGHLALRAQSGKKSEISSLQLSALGAQKVQNGVEKSHHFVYTCVGTRVSTHVSTRVGAYLWDNNTEKTNFGGHCRVHLRVHSREHLREPLSWEHWWVIMRFRHLCASLKKSGFRKRGLANGVSPFFFLKRTKNGKKSEPEKTAETEKTERNRKERKKTERKGKKRKKTEENGKNRKRHRSGDPFCETPKKQG